MAVDLVYWKNKPLKSVFRPNKRSRSNVEKFYDETRSLYSSSYITRMMERKCVWVRHEMCTKFFLGKPEGHGISAKPKRSWVVMVTP